MDVTPERFESLVADALDSLPAALGEQMENVAVMVEDRPTREQLTSVSGERQYGTLFGLYEGIALTERSPLSYAGVLPDRITIFRLPICRAVRTEEALVELVRTTVIHEVAHHFGISDERLDELGWA